MTETATETATATVTETTAAETGTTETPTVVQPDETTWNLLIGIFAGTAFLVALVGALLVIQLRG